MNPCMHIHTFHYTWLHCSALRCVAFGCIARLYIHMRMRVCMYIYIYRHSYILISFSSLPFFPPSLSLSLKGKHVQRCGRVCANIKFLQEIDEIKISHYFISRCYFPKLFRIYHDWSLIFSRQADLCLAKAWKLCGFGAHCPCGKGLTIGQWLGVVWHLRLWRNQCFSFNMEVCWSSFCMFLCHH